LRLLIFFNSGLDVLFLVVYLGIQTVEVLDESIAPEWNLRLLVIGMILFNLFIDFLPLLVQILSIGWILLNLIVLLLVNVHFQRLIEGKRVNFLQDCLQGNQGLLKNLVPVVLGEVNDDGNEHWESFILVSLQNVQEVIVLEEAHRSVCHLEMDSTDALHNSLEKSWDEWINLVNLTHFEDFLELGQKECFLDAIGERPVF